MDVSRGADPLKSILGAALVPLKIGRCERYCARFDAHLDTLPDDTSRRLFCDRELANWTTLYEKFATQVDLGNLEPDDADGPTSFDYILTITEISSRQARYPAVSA